MLSVKLVRFLVLGETIFCNNNHPFLHHHHDELGDVNGSHTITHDEYDADDDENDDNNNTHLQKPRIKPSNGTKTKKKKMPLLLFLPTKELISDTFRLASIARDIGMDFHPSPSLSHLLFSWPSSSSSLTTISSCSPLSSSSSSSNHRPSVSSTITSTTTSTSASSCSLWGGTIPNDAVPLPFPSLSTVSSISLLRHFVSLSKGLFKLVFLEINPDSRFNLGNLYNNCGYNNYDCSSNVSLFSRVSGKHVNTMEEFSRVLAGNGWALFRSSENKNTAVTSSVFLFRKTDSNRVRAKKVSNEMGGGGECRIRELRLPSLDFKNGVPLRVLQYILLMTDNVFYLA